MHLWTPPAAGLRVTLSVAVVNNKTSLASDWVTRQDEWWTSRETLALRLFRHQIIRALAKINRRWIKFIKTFELQTVSWVQHWLSQQNIREFFFPTHCTFKTCCLPCTAETVQHGPRDPHFIFTSDGCWKERFLDFREVLKTWQFPAAQNLRHTSGRFSHLI